MVKAKTVIVLLFASILYMVLVLNFFGVRSNIGNRGLRNYLLRGTAFLPVCIVIAGLLFYLIRHYFVNVRGSGAAFNVKLSFAMGAVILLVLCLWGGGLSIRTISNYSYDVARGPRNMVLTQAAIQRKPASYRKTATRIGGYLIKGMDEGGNQKGIWLSKQDAAQYENLNGEDTLTVEYYEKTNVLFKIH